MRDGLVPLGVALLCICAVALGAAALTSSAGGGDSVPGLAGQANGNGSEGGGAGSGGASGPLQAGQADGECVGGYDQTEIAAIATMLIAVIAVLVAVFTEEAMLGVLALPILLIPTLFVLTGVFAVLDCPPPNLGPTENVTSVNITENALEDAGNEGEGTPLGVHLQWGGIIGGLVLLVLLLGLYVQYRDSDSAGEEPEMAVRDIDPGIAEAAGEAADELAGPTDSENGVYRAWVRMTEVLDVDHPETSTPREFADAALAAGLNPDDVAELTELFETVRYGPTDVTDEHERRAREALRRIEREHSVDETERTGHTDEQANGSPRDDGGDG